MSSGGAEHQLSILSHLLCEEGYSVTITTFSDIEDHYKIDPRIKRTRLGNGKSNIYKQFCIMKYALTTQATCFVGFGYRESCLVLLPMLLRIRLKFIVGERNLSQPNMNFFQRLYRKVLYKRANYIVPNSESQSQLIKQSYPNFSKKVRTIHNYTDLNYFTPNLCVHNAIPRVGIFARYHDQKNCVRFINVVKELKNKNYKFVVDWYGNKHVGSTLNPMFLRMQDLISKYKLQDYLKLHDHVAEVKTEFTKFDAIALPSLFEGFSNSISEAICCAKPMIVSRVSDNPVMVKDGVNGFLFDPLDENDMVHSFEKFFRLTKEEKIEMCRNSRSIAECLFDSESFITKYTNILID